MLRIIALLCVLAVAQGAGISAANQVSKSIITRAWEWGMYWAGFSDAEWGQYCSSHLGGEYDADEWTAFFSQYSLVSWVWWQAKWLAQKHHSAVRRAVRRMAESIRSRL